MIKETGREGCRWREKEEERVRRIKGEVIRKLIRHGLATDWDGSGTARQGRDELAVEWDGNGTIRLG